MVQSIYQPIHGMNERNSSVDTWRQSTQTSAGHYDTALHQYTTTQIVAAVVVIVIAIVVVLAVVMVYLNDCLLPHVLYAAPLACYTYTDVVVEVEVVLAVEVAAV